MRHMLTQFKAKVKVKTWVFSDAKDANHFNLDVIDVTDFQIDVIGLKERTGPSLNTAI